LKRRLIEVHRRHLRIVDVDALREVVLGRDVRGKRRTRPRAWDSRIEVPA
jgi:hypothetical protein